MPPRGLKRGFTVVDLLAVLLLVGLVVGVFLVLRPVNGYPSNRVECMNNVKNLVGLLEAVGDGDYPQLAGANLILCFVRRGELENADELSLLFCPGDTREHLDPTAYRDLDLTRRGAYGHLTSYAGRDQLDPACRARRGDGDLVLVCDDSDDHHDGGYVVGLRGGAARWREDVPEFEVGPESAVEELRCLRAD